MYGGRSSHQQEHETPAQLAAHADVEVRVQRLHLCARALRPCMQPLQSRYAGMWDVQPSGHHQDRHNSVGTPSARSREPVMETGVGRVTHMEGCGACAA